MTAVAAVEELLPETVATVAVATLANAAQRARAELNRQRARALRSARTSAGCTPRGPKDTGGGFLLSPEQEAPAPLAAAPSAPLVDPAARPHCLECDRPIALSYLLDTFGHAVCDACRDTDADAEGSLSLLTRTEAKSSYLLRDCDLDARHGGPLRCVRRRNPHSARGDMRLYLRAQVEERALAVWGSEEALEAELDRRAAARGEAGARREARRLRALRMDVRSSLFRAPRSHHEHAFAPETYDAHADLYTRTCACGHTETYEKM